MIGKNFIYSLETTNGIPRISYSLGLKILWEDKSKITIELPNEIVTLNKSEYLNHPHTSNFKIFDNKTVFFIICSKQVTGKYAFHFLLNYASKKLEKQINSWQSLKNACDRLILPQMADN